MPVTLYVLRDYNGVYQVPYVSSPTRWDSQQSLSSHVAPTNLSCHLFACSALGIALAAVAVADVVVAVVAVAVVAVVVGNWRCHASRFEPGNCAFLMFFTTSNNTKVLLIWFITSASFPHCHCLSAFASASASAFVPSLLLRLLSYARLLLRNCLSCLSCLLVSPSFVVPRRLSFAFAFHFIK